MKNGLHIGDSMELSGLLDDSTIDLTITSPPYADTLSYGRKVKTYDEGDYAEWFLPLAKELYRATKETGSFILNINDRVIDGSRSIYVLDLICRIVRETDWTLQDRYIWAKKSGLPMGRDYPTHSRLDDKLEYIFHFVKTRKNFKSNIDEVREPYAEISKKRMKTPIGFNKAVGDDGISSIPEREWTPNEKGKIPTTVFDFPTSGTLRGHNHPAMFHPELPRWFIRWLTNPGDVVLDPFMGSGTTAVVCKEENREWIGFEINDSYKDILEERIKNTDVKSDLTELFEE